MAHTGRLLVEYAFFAPITCPTRFRLPTPIHPREVGRDNLLGVGADLEGQFPNWFVSCLLLFRNFCARLDVWSFAHLLRLRSYDCRSWQFQQN